jgi:hypothetical protein
MSHLGNRSLRNYLILLLLSVVACAPIWSVRYFINQDGSGHVYGAWLMTQLLETKEPYSRIFQFNFPLFPNSSGHWLLVLILQFAGAFMATKIMSTVTYVSFAASVGWLARHTTSALNVPIALIFGAVLGFNSLWLVGFYNFNIGLVSAVVGVGLYFRWRVSMSVARAAALALIFVFTFFSHAIAFIILAAAISILAVLPTSIITKRNLSLTVASIAPVFVVGVLYKLSSGSSGNFVPIWSSLKDPYSISDWINQLRSFDSLVIISRKTFPFFQGESVGFAVFTPLLWVAVGLLFIAAASWPAVKQMERPWMNTYFPFAVLFAGCMLVALFWPDFLKFENSAGGILRERVFLAGLIFLVPLFRFDKNRCWTKPIVASIFIFVFAYQCAAVWEYAIRSDRDAAEYLSAEPHLENGSTMTALVFDDTARRFSSNPISSLDNYFAIGGDVFVWDNYEFGHYLFPVVLKNDADRRFAFDYTSSNTYDLSGDEKLAKLTSVFSNDHERIDTLLVWGSNDKLEPAFKPYFESEPYFANGRVRLCRHR